MNEAPASGGTGCQPDVAWDSPLDSSLSAYAFTSVSNQACKELAREKAHLDSTLVLFSMPKSCQSWQAPGILGLICHQCRYLVLDGDNLENFKCLLETVGFQAQELMLY